MDDSTQEHITCCDMEELRGCRLRSVALREASAVVRSWWCCAAVVWVEGWGDREVEWMDRSRLDDKRWGIHCLSFR